MPSTSSTFRLVIRVRIIPEGLPGAPGRRRLSRGALTLILGLAALLLTWVGLSMFRTERTSAPAATLGAVIAESPSLAPVPTPGEAAAGVRDQPLAELAAKPAQTKSAQARSVESEVRQQPEVSTSPINEAIPDVPRSARETIRGTVRVSVRVIVGKEGTVLGATVDQAGPSRYFERLAIEASRKWTFTQADSQAQRIIVVTFNFTRAGTTARVNSLQ